MYISEPESPCEGSRGSSVPTSGVHSHKSSVGSIDDRIDDLRYYSPLQDPQPLSSAIEVSIQKILKAHFDTRFDQLRGEIRAVSQKVDEVYAKLKVNQSSAVSSESHPHISGGETLHHPFYGANTGDNKSGQKSPQMQLKRDSNRASQRSTISNSSVQLAAATEETAVIHERREEKVSSIMNADVQVGNVVHRY